MQNANQLTSPSDRFYHCHLGANVMGKEAMMTGMEAMNRLLLLWIIQLLVTKPKAEPPYSIFLQRCQLDSQLEWIRLNPFHAGRNSSLL
jgi:hypothetical protein